MKTKIELDFQYWRFWTFSLLGFTLSATIGYFNFVDKNPFAARLMKTGGIVAGILYILCSIQFFCVYYKLRSNLD